MLEVNQHSSGGHPVLERGNIRAWVGDGPKAGEHYLAVFNLGESQEALSLNWQDVGISGDVADVRDLWRHKSYGTLREIHASLRPHASLLYRVSIR